MSLRRKVLIVVVLVNLATLAGLAAFAFVEGRNVRDVVEETASVAEARAESAIGLLESWYAAAIDDEIQGILATSPEARRRQLGVPETAPEEAVLLLAIRQSPLFDQPEFRKLVRKGVLVRLATEDQPAAFFNIRRGLIFEEGALDRSRARDHVERAQRSGEVVEVGDRIAGPLRAGERPWGGFYLALSDVAAMPVTGAYDRFRPLRIVLVIGVPGTLLLVWVLWLFLRGSVVGPLEELAAVADSVAAGDYSRRLPPSPRRDEVGAVVSAVNRMLDLVSDYRERMEARILEKTEEIERKNRELMRGQRLAATGTLASGIAHEINNPLGGMLNAVKRLERGDLDPQRCEQYLQLVEEGIGRIQEIVQQVLAVSPRKTTPVAVSIPNEIRRVAGLVAHRARQLDVAVEIRMAEDVPPVLGETNEIGQIFLNLLINGIDACESGGHVEVDVRRTGAWVETRVHDDGVGMDAQTAARAFDLFFTTKEAGRGTGLGLATVHSLVESHGGSIVLRTAPGEGATFTVRLPVGETRDGAPRA